MNMAGSWNHITDNEQRLRYDDHTIENLGDAIEAFEECYGMVWWLAARLVEARGYSADDLTAIRNVIEDAQSNYGDGVRLGMGEGPQW
jgi:hypothetical protein